MATIIDLDALVSDTRLPRVRLFGAEHTVRPLTGAQAHRLAALPADDTGGAMLEALLAVVARSVPTLTAEQVEALTLEQLSKIVELSRGDVAAVEAQLAAQQAAQDGATSGN